MGTKIIQAENFARSAIAPLMSAAVRIANVNWKVANNTSGTFPCTVDGSMPAMPMCSSPPMMPP
ncbi:hypothetical protein N806_29910 [Rhodococcus sp. P27]|nr:hypothetical protein N806_29910 [Rhodococcus sp. P27]